MTEQHKTTGPFSVGDVETDPADGYFADWVPVLDAAGVEVCRVGYTFWRFRLPTPRKWQEGEREAMARRIVEALNA